MVLKKQNARGGADGGLLELKAAPLGTEPGPVTSVNKHLVPVLKGEAHDSKAQSLGLAHAVAHKPGEGRGCRGLSPLGLLPPNRPGDKIPPASRLPVAQQGRGLFPAASPATPAAGRPQESSSGCPQAAVL